MAKRFTDTEKWDRPWFRQLPPRYKCLWEFIRDKCDLAGIWYVDFEMAQFTIGEGLDLETAKCLFEKQILVIDESRWHIPSFISFQYGALTPTNNLHRAVISRLQRFKLAPNQPLNVPSQGDQDKEKVSFLLKEEPERNKFQESFEKFWSCYPKKRSKGDALKAWRKINPSSELASRITAAVTRAKTSPDWLKDGGQFIPYPASWLNAQGWEDDIVSNRVKDEVVV